MTKPAPLDTEQRVHPRFRFRCDATLAGSHESWGAHLLNISETGVLIAVLDSHNLQSGDSIQLVINITTQKSIQLLGSIAHINEHYVGIESSPFSVVDQRELLKIVNQALPLVK